MLGGIIRAQILPFKPVRIQVTPRLSLLSRSLTHPAPLTVENQQREGEQQRLGDQPHGGIQEKQGAVSSHAGRCLIWSRALKDQQK